MKKFIGFFVKQGLFADLISVFVILIGIMAIFSVKREVFPNISFDVVRITTILPGAGPEKIEKLVTNPIEQAMKEVDGIKRLTSISSESTSVILAQIDPDQVDVTDAKESIKDVIGRVSDLPEAAEDPDIKLVESKQQPIIEVSISGDVAESELREVAKRLERELELVSGVAKIVPRGLREREIRVQANPEVLKRYRLSLDDLVMSLQGTNVGVPAGIIETDLLNPESRERIIQTTSEFERLEDIENAIIRSNEAGYGLRVKDVAKVSWDLERAKLLNRTNGTPSIGLTVLKKPAADAINLVDGVRAKMKQLESTLPAGVRYTYINDVSILVKNRLSVLTGNLVLGLILVLVILSLLLPFRVALLVSLGIPFAFMGTLAMFYYTDVSVNLISLLGLIIVVGMLVDDAVVVTDNCVRKIEEGEDPETAAVDGASEVFSPVIASVLTTVFAFLPLMMMTGIFGKFVGQLPLGVIYGLLFSLIEAFIVLPYHIRRWIRRPDPNAKAKNAMDRVLKTTNRLWNEKAVPAYEAALRWCLEKRYKVAGTTVLLLVGSIALVGFKMKLVLFPPDGVEIFFVRAEAPLGYSLEQTGELLKPVEAEIAKIPRSEMKDFIATVGIQQKDPNDPETKRGSQYGQVIVYLTPEQQRKRTANQIMEEVRARVGQPPGFVRLTFERVNPGPPQGKAVDIGIRGDDFEKINAAAAGLKERVKEIPGTTDVSDSYITGKEQVTIKLNLSEVAAAGLSVATVGATVRTAYEGTPATTIRTLDEEIDVRVLMEAGSRQTDKTLEQIFIRNPQGNLVPLSHLARFERESTVAWIEHEENRRQVRVFANVDVSKTDARRVNGVMKEFLNDYRKLHPEVTFEFLGENKDTAESLVSLRNAFFVAFGLIFLILVLTFQNLIQPILVAGITIPLGVIAVIIAFFLHGLPLSFLGIMGVIALAGVIVNNAIVFVDATNEARKKGADPMESIIQTGRLRLRPIFLTTVTTVCGVLPTAYGIGGLDRFVVPIAIALGWGLAVGSVLTTFVFPAALAITDDISKFLSKKFGKKFREKNSGPAYRNGTHPNGSGSERSPSNPSPRI